MLSKENAARLCETGIYKAQPSIDLVYDEALLKKMNWTFRVSRNYKNELCMIDTCFEKPYITLTDENIDRFELVVDLNDVIEWSYYLDEYDEKDVFCIALDSCGLRYNHYFIRKDAQPMREKVIKRYEKDIKYLKREIKEKERILKALKENKIDDLRYL